MSDDERRAKIRQETMRVHEAAKYSAETQLEFAKRWQ
jgi:hypothetical protein